MLSLAQFNLPLLVSALLIGVATAWWIRRGRRPAPPDDKSEP